MRETLKQNNLAEARRALLFSSEAQPFACAPHPLPDAPPAPALRRSICCTPRTSTRFFDPADLASFESVQMSCAAASECWSASLRVVQHLITLYQPAVDQPAGSLLQLCNLSQQRTCREDQLHQ